MQLRITLPKGSHVLNIIFNHSIIIKHEGIYYMYIVYIYTMYIYINIYYIFIQYEA